MTSDRSNSTINKTLQLTEKSFSYTILGFAQSHPDPLNDLPQEFLQKKPRTYKSEKPINITGIDKIHSKCDCIDGSIVNGVRESILDSFALDKPPGRKIYREPSIKLFEKINKSFISYLISSGRRRLQTS